MSSVLTFTHIPLVCDAVAETNPAGVIHTGEGVVSEKCLRSDVTHTQESSPQSKLRPLCSSLMSTLLSASFLTHT